VARVFSDLAGVFVDHEVIDVPELLSVALNRRTYYTCARGVQLQGAWLTHNMFVRR
jgi:hypothetical protein